MTRRSAESSRGDHAIESPNQFLLAERASAEKFPPLLHQAAILEQLGEVSILDAPGRHDDPRILTSEQVQRIRIGATDNRSIGRAAANAKWALRYALEFKRCIHRSPNVAIAYEPEAAALLLRARLTRERTMRIVHLHEIPDKSLYSRSTVSTIALRYMLANLAAADLVVLPDADRAEFTAEVAKLRQVPVVVMNCPPLLAHLPASKLLPWLAERGAPTNRIVHFQGSLGHDRALARVIESMTYWPSDSVFVMVGDGPPSVRRELMELAQRRNVSNRVLFVGRVPYSEVMPFAVGAQVGVTLLEPINSNLRLASGASNKRFEYAALGIPQVTNTAPGVEKVFGTPSIAMTVDIDNVGMIGKAIAHLLLDTTVAREIGTRARTTHLNRYNYEFQFAPVVSRIREWLSLGDRSNACSP